jgi:hypothetical protein
MPASVRDDREHLPDDRMRGDEHRLGEEHLLRQKAVEQRHAGHRGAGDQRERHR